MAPVTDWSVEGADDGPDDVHADGEQAHHGGGHGEPRRPPVHSGHAPAADASQDGGRPEHDRQSAPVSRQRDERPGGPSDRGRRRRLRRRGGGPGACLLCRGTGRRAARPFPELTDREIEILHLIADGRSNLDIARRLHLADKTVRNHVSNVFTKLQVSDRPQAIVRAREAGLGTTGGS